MSKKYLVLISIMLVVVSMFSIAAHAAPESKDMVFYTDFEDGKLDGWDVGGTVKIIDVPGGKGKCVFLERTDAEGDAHDPNAPAPTFMQKVFDKPLEGIVMLEFKMMTNEHKSSQALLIRNIEKGDEEEVINNVLRVQFNGNAIRVLQPEGSANLDLVKPFEVNKWYHFKVVINTVTGKADVYIDGKKEAEQINTEIPPKNIAAIRPNMAAKTRGLLYLDDIMVYQEGVAPKADAPKADAPKADAPKADAPKADAPKADAPKADAPKADAPKADAPKAGTPKNPKTGDSGLVMYGLILASAVVTTVVNKRK